MRKRAYTIVEIILVLLLMGVVTYFVAPNIVNDSSMEARFSLWKTGYNTIVNKYQGVTALNIEPEDGDTINYKNISHAIIQAMQPKKVFVSKDYNIRFKDKSFVPYGNLYFFQEFYLLEKNTVLGVKVLNEECDTEQVCGMIMLDVNGAKKPNVWGLDIFGLNVYATSIEPICRGMSYEDLKFGCAAGGQGVCCSEFYLVGGTFNE